MSSRGGLGSVLLQTLRLAVPIYLAMTLLALIPTTIAGLEPCRRAFGQRSG